MEKQMLETDGAPTTLQVADEAAHIISYEKPSSLAAQEVRTLSMQETATKTSAGTSMERLSAAETLEASPQENQQMQSALQPKEEAINTVVCHEWETQFANLPKADEQEVVYSCIPEKDAILWHIKDLTAFRAAARVSKIPPLVSPEFGGGCCLRLQLYDRKGHISGRIELPLIKAVKDGVAHIKICVVRPDLKVITTRKVEVRVHSPSGIDRKDVTRASESFFLTKARPFCSAQVDRLVVDDALRIRINFQYFPFDAQIFRGLGRPGQHQLRNDMDHMKHAPHTGNSSVSYLNHAPNASTHERRAELLTDISSYCAEDPVQYVEIRRGDAVFQACRFLLCARSTKLRDIFKTGNTSPLTARGSSPYSGGGRCPGSQHSLSSITLQDISADCLDQMLTYIHTDSCQWLDDHSTHILNVLELFEAADNYGAQSLKRRLRAHLAERLDRENFVFMFETSERCNDAEFKQICTDFMDSIPGSQVATLMRITSLGGHAETPRTSTAV